MVEEIELDGKGWARGRNGYFVPRRVDCFKDVRGMVNLSVASSRAGKADPISLRITREEALELGNRLLLLAGTGLEAAKVVVVLEGGNVQEILSNRPGIEALLMDYDTEGADRKEVKRVLQEGYDGRKSYEPAYFGLWGKAKLDPRNTNRFFRNAGFKGGKP